VTVLYMSSFPLTPSLSTARSPSSPPLTARFTGHAWAPRQWWAAFACTLTLIGAEAFFMGPLWTRGSMVAAATLVLSSTLTLTGAILWGEQGQRGTALLLVLAGLLWAAGWSEEWGGGVLPLTAELCSPLALLAGAWAVLRYPDPELMDLPDRLFLVVLALWEVGGQLGYDLTGRPEWSSYPRDSWWLTIHADHGLHDTVGTVANAGAVPLAVVFLFLWVRRSRRVRGLDRRLLAPITVSALLAAVVSAAVPVAQLAGLPERLLYSAYAVETGSLVAVPVAFLIAVVRRQLNNTAVLDLVREVQRRPTPEAVQHSLQAALGDPSLRVSYWAPELRSYVDVGGLRVEPPPDPALRLVVPISNGAGEPLAVIDTDPGLRRHTDVVTGAASASGLALENAQLQASVRAQLAQVRASRLRIVEAGVAERRRLERDLHDGAQQRLLALRLALAAADDGSLQPPEQAFLREVSQEVAVALAELRDLARGIHPAVLSQAGLSAAVEAVVERQSMAVDAQLPARRFPAAIEATAYATICEAVDNAARHATATRVRIRGHAAEGVLTIEVEDDGCGGAQVRIGAGLSGLIDRVRALGGDLMISSPPGRGTLLVAAIPCG
jgi:signal transduction histidine kinase